MLSFFSFAAGLFIVVLLIASGIKVGELLFPIAEREEPLDQAPRLKEKS